MAVSDPSGDTELRVIIVDDDPLFASLGAAALEKQGFSVRAAQDGVRGLELLDAGKFDLAIVDLCMPRVDGLRLIALIRGAARHKRLAILVVSARSDAEAFREALNIGADAVDLKPLDWKVLPERVRAIVGKRRSELAASANARAAG